MRKADTYVLLLHLAVPWDPAGNPMRCALRQLVEKLLYAPTNIVTWLSTRIAAIVLCSITCICEHFVNAGWTIDDISVLAAPSD
jgi:hypothetical protein